MQHLSSEFYEPLSDSALDEMESYISEALAYRHIPEFATECARLIAEVRRLRSLVDGSELPAAIPHSLLIDEQAA
jgi:hypothetical protein